MKALLLFSLCWGVALVRGVPPEPSPSPTPEPLPTPESNDGGPVYSSDLDAIFTPCRSWIFPCGEGTYQCTPQYAYYIFLYGPQPLCPSVVNSTATPPPGVCTADNYTSCSFSPEAPTCVSWLGSCDFQYSCTTEEEYLASSNTTDFPCFFPVSPPTLPATCVPINNTCQWYSPCYMWQEHCLGDYRCGNVEEYGRFLGGPQPICAPINSSEPAPIPPGVCLYQDGQCEWSECRSWLSPCQTSWECGSDYLYRVAQSLPPPPCPNPGEHFVPPPEPGVCAFDIELGGCEFHGQLECTGGQEYQECGTPCPRTCDNYQLDLACELSCFPGCYCPNDTVLHEGECIDSSLCPGTTTCSGGKEWQDCGTACPPTCDNYNTTIICTTQCVSGCFCPEGMVDHNGECVDPSACPATCSGGKEWQDCGTACPLTCDNYNTTFGCTEQCVSGCFCPQGMVDYNGECIAPSECVATCSGGKEWQDCGTACPLTCDNYNTTITCTEQCVSGCFCPQGMVDLGGECVDPSACPGPCAVVRCASGRICRVHEPTNSAYCDPSCDHGFDSVWCEEGEECELMEGNCEEGEPCPHTVQCVPATCSGGKEWQDCGTACPLTCDNYDTVFGCTDNCVPGCFCPEGMVDHNGECVDPSQCPATCSGGKEWQDCGTACPLTCDNYGTSVACTLQCVSGCFCPQGMVDLNGECVNPLQCPEPLSGPCKQWRFPCGDMPYRCTSHDEYQQFVMGPQLRCPVYENSTSLLPPGQCVLSNNTCQFSSDAPTCATWISYCSFPYQCGTQEELDSLPTAQTNCPLMLDIPPPDMTCEPIDGQCQWYNPCRKWRQHCSGEWQCGTLERYVQFLYGPLPGCFLPPNFTQPVLTGECIPQDNQCVWSECRSWLGECGRRWICSTQHDFDEASAIPTPCAPPPTPTPIEPGTCSYNESAQQCQYVPAPKQCKLWRFPCGDMPYRCTSYEEYQQFLLGPQLGCPVYANSSSLFPPGQCVLIDDTCQFSPYAPAIPIPCSSDVTHSCPSHARCLSFNSTGSSFCLDSCYLQNGGCSEDQVCFSEGVDDGSCGNPWSGPCTSTSCMDLSDVQDTCPPGWEYYQCGDLCQLSCEDYLIDPIRPCPEICGPPACVCPQGMVVFRDRCVDPLECHVLLTDSPPLNPLPVPPDTLLIQLTITGVVIGNFNSSEFVELMESLLEDLGFEEVDISVHTVLQEEEQIEVVLQFEGEAVNNELSGSRLAALIMDHPNRLNAEVAAISTVDAPTIPEDDDDEEDGLSGAAIAAVVVAVVVVICALLVVLAITAGVVVVWNKAKTTKRVEISSDGEEKLSYVQLYSKENEYELS